MLVRIRKNPKKSWKAKTKPALFVMLSLVYFSFLITGFVAANFSIMSKLNIASDSGLPPPPSNGYLTATAVGDTTAGTITFTVIPNNPPLSVGTGQGITEYAFNVDPVLGSGLTTANLNAPANWHASSPDSIDSYKKFSFSLKDGVNAQNPLVFTLTGLTSAQVVPELINSNTFNDNGYYDAAKVTYDGRTGFFTTGNPWTETPVTVVPEFPVNGLLLALVLLPIVLIAVRKVQRS